MDSVVSGQPCTWSDNLMLLWDVMLIAVLMDHCDEDVISERMKLDRL